ncbi:12932_t:CDS:1 [Acaulospora morrowiae]|uniref:12932_t:CDS:1 n=1 Tax=Acaulospora morrowiae TaxID=94023 RepID=A0A9N9G5C2_9GLOM|nr:12932_t:CDS:1 [Acaulospora morrowiae]
MQIELFLYRCKLFFKALNEGKTSFFFSDVHKWLHSAGDYFFPEYIRAPLHRLHGEYSWDQKDTNKIIELIVKALSRVYPSYFTSEMVSINYTNRTTGWASFNSSQSLMNSYEANLQNKLVKNFECLFPKNWLLGFKLLYKYDWHPVPNRPDKGRNDIILTNGKGIFAVVETKVINSYNSYEKLRDVKRQATDYKAMFLEHFADDPAVIAVIGVWFTNENRVGFSSEIDETIAKVVEPGKVCLYINNQHIY